MNRYRRLLSVIALVAAPAAGADVDGELAPVYERGGDIPIGRVFLSQRDRDRLDERRGKPESNASNAANTTEPTAAAPTRPAGFIKRSSGPTRVWRDGNFVTVGPEARRNVDFPGEVRITRHEALEESRQAPGTGQRDERDEAD